MRRHVETESRHTCLPPTYVTAGQAERLAGFGELAAAKQLLPALACHAGFERSYSPPQDSPLPLCKRHRLRCFVQHAKRSLDLVERRARERVIVSAIEREHLALISHARSATGHAD